MKQHTIPFTLLYAWSNEFDNNDIKTVNPNPNSRRNAKVRFANVSSAYIPNLSYEETKIDFANSVSVIEDQYRMEDEKDFSQYESKLGALRSNIYKDKKIDRNIVLPLVNYFLKKTALMMEEEAKKLKYSSERHEEAGKRVMIMHTILKELPDINLKLKIIRNNTGIPFVTSTTLSFINPNHDFSLDTMFPITPDILIGIKIIKERNGEFEYNQFTWHTDIHKSMVQKINLSIASNASSRSQLIYPFNNKSKELFGGVNIHEGFKMVGADNISKYIKFNK